MPCFAWLTWQTSFQSLRLQQGKLYLFFFPPNAKNEQWFPGLHYVKTHILLALRAGQTHTWQTMNSTPPLLSHTIKCSLIREVICAQGRQLFSPPAGQWSVSAHARFACLSNRQQAFVSHLKCCSWQIPRCICFSLAGDCHKTLFRAASLHGSQSRTRACRVLTSRGKTLESSLCFLLGVRDTLLLSH